MWSAQTGYPGDGVYREFHKKHEHSGNRYWRLTGRDEIATVGIVEDGRMVEDRSFQVWRRCGG